MKRDHSRSPPLDQADGLRRLFAALRVCVLPVVSNPNVAWSGVMLERLCTAFAEHGRHTLVVDAAERAAEHAEMALLDLAECIEPLSRQVSYLAARGLPLRYVDATGSTADFITALSTAAPQCDVLLIHASASELCRLFGRGAVADPVRPLLLADDRPASVTHAYAALKLLVQRADLVVHDLLLGAAPHSPRAARIAAQIGTCADDFLGAVLHDWVQIDPASDACEPPTVALRRLVREQLRAAGSVVAGDLAGDVAGAAAPVAASIGAPIEAPIAARATKPAGGAGCTRSAVPAAAARRAAASVSRLSH